MASTVHGIHHVTCIAGPPQRNVDFYVGVLGLRLVKRSVNQDAPDTYHLFYADGVGTPGTDITFFPWPAMEPVQLGIGLTVEIPFAVRPGSLAYWQDRLAQAGVATDPVETRFGELTLPFRDPDGLGLALTETADGRDWTPWRAGPVPEAHQLRGMHTVRLWERQLTPTEMLLTQRLGFVAAGEEDGWRRYAVDGGGSGRLVDVREMPGERRGRWGTGGVHHVAWRTHDAAEEMAVREGVAQGGLRPTALIDRFWFESVYFKEPGGVLFELATDGPGFDRDEDMAHLGETLILPPWLEPHRRDIEAVLPPLTMPT
ncbi:MAG: ring-cleaving dioxygenase [Anaerolineae bacterium]|nr:ring-cleaving dioxygenase [Anaerolineae bacterium]